MNLKLLTLLMFSSSYAIAGDAPDVKDYSNNATGDWHGRRAELYNYGIDIVLDYKLDYINVLNGGLKPGQNILDNVDLIFNFDGEKLMHSPGTKAMLRFVSNHGGRPNENRVGSLGQVDNIEVNKSAIRLAEAWVAQDFYNGKLNILVGQHDLNSAFYSTASAGIFLQPTYGIGAEFSPVNSEGYGPSVFPYYTAGVKAKIAPNDKFYLQLAVYDDLVARPQHLSSSLPHVNKHNGVLAIAEMGSTTDYGNYSLGAWGYSKKFNDLLNPDIMRRNEGYYLMAEKFLYKGALGKEIIAFYRLGFADKRVSQIDYSWSAGIAINEVITGRKNSQLGLGMAKAHVGTNFVQETDQMTEKTRASETSFEVTYSDNITPWMKIQPDIQYIIHPSGNPVESNAPYLKNSFIIGARFTFNL